MNHVLFLTGIRKSIMRPMLIALIGCFAICCSAPDQLLAQDSAGGFGSSCGSGYSVSNVSYKFAPFANMRARMNARHSARMATYQAARSCGSCSSGNFSSCSGGNCVMTSGSSGGYGARGNVASVECDRFGNCTYTTHRCNCCEKCTGQPGCTCGCAGCKCSGSTPVSDHKDAAPPNDAVPPKDKTSSGE